jgi:dihydrofolate reductase
MCSPLVERLDRDVEEVCDVRGAPETIPFGLHRQGSVFVLTHHPEDATPAAGVTFLSCDVAEAVRIALEAADGKNVEVLSASIGAQLIARGLIDEIDLHIAPVLLGDGIRLFDNPGGTPVRLDRVHDGAPNADLDVRYRPVRRPTRPRPARTAAAA